jgi:TPR repeat protein
VPHFEVLAMYEKEAIYLAKRPVGNKLYNRVVNPIEPKVSSKFFILGQKENNSGEAFLKDKYNELGGEKAFVLFQKSSELGYPKGQVNLATMYINGNVVDKDLNKALYLLKAASLKSHKPAILKYGIICNQVPHCDEYSFYQELYNSGVNIKVREVKVKPHDIVNTKK